MNRCFIVIEHVGKEIRPVSYELQAAALELQKLEPVQLSAVIIGSGVTRMAETYSAWSGLQTYVIEIPGLESYQSDAYCAALADLLRQYPAAYIIGAHSTQGLDFFPALAIRMKAGCITGVESIGNGEGQVIFERSICNGKLVTGMTCKADTAVLTIQPGSFKPASTMAAEPDMIHREFSFKADRMAYVETRASDTDSSALKEAKVIIAAGRGIEDAENLDLIRNLSKLFNRSAVAGSRPLCDLGWLEYSQQVGITGATVSPDLYIACGISGTSQHVTGMKGSGYIVSINKDPKSAMFTISDLCIVEDLMEFLPMVIETCQKEKNGVRAKE